MEIGTPAPSTRFLSWSAATRCDTRTRGSWHRGGGFNRGGRRMSIIDELAKHVYLGDGVYAYHDGYQVWLATDGNAIALEPGVMQALMDYNADVIARIRAYNELTRENRIN